MQDQHQKMLDKIKREAVRAFGEEGAQRWLNRRWRVFDDRTPIDMARHRDGSRRVLDYVSYLTAAEEACREARIKNFEH